MKTAKHLVVLICAALALLGSSPPASDDDIVWADAGHTLPTFISGPVLDRVASGSVAEIMRDTGLSHRDATRAKQGLKALLDHTREALAAHPELAMACLPFEPGVLVFPNLKPSSVSLADLVRRGDIAVVGTVERAVAGLYLDSSSLATDASLRVTEVLRDTSTTIQVGKTLSFLKHGGTITYRGAKLCSDSAAQGVSAAGEHLPVVGERLLVIGVRGYGEPNPSRLLASEIFVIANGDVIPNAAAYPYLKDTQAKPIDLLRTEIVAKGG